VSLKLQLQKFSSRNFQIRVNVLKILIIAHITFISSCKKQILVSLKCEVLLWDTNKVLLYFKKQLFQANKKYTDISKEFLSIFLYKCKYFLHNSEPLIEIGPNWAKHECLHDYQNILKLSRYSMKSTIFWDVMSLSSLMFQMNIPRPSSM
jgi:hypothetical protein